MFEGDNGTRRDDRLTELWAWAAVDTNDNCEGIVTAALNYAGQTVPMPLIGADERRIRSLRSHAEHAAAVRGVPVRLVRFTDVQEIEVIRPPDDTFTHDGSTASASH